MGNLCEPDVRRLMACCAEIYRWDDLDTGGDAEAGTFAEHVVGLLPSLLHGAVATYQSFQFKTRTTEMVLSGWHEEIAAHAPAFFAYLQEHPLIEAARDAAYTRSLRISDVVPWTTFQKTGLYNEFYRQVGLGHQMAVSMPAGDGEVVGLALSREAGEANFSEQDKEILDVFRLHVLQAQAIARRLAGLRSRLNEVQEMLEAVDEGVVSLDSGLQVTAASKRAAVILEKHFGSRRSRDLPRDVQAWVQAQVTGFDRSSAPRCATALETAAGTVRLQLARRGRLWILVLEEAGGNSGVRPLPEHLRAKLTKREAEVLQWISTGKTNPEIAIILGASPRTVQKHVEHILEKLNVENRHAAAMRVLEFSA